MGFVIRTKIPNPPSSAVCNPLWICKFILFLQFQNISFSIMVIINWKWSEMSLTKVWALLSISTLVFVRSNLAFHAYVFFIIQILMNFGQIQCPTYFWSGTKFLKTHLMKFTLLDTRYKVDMTQAHFLVQILLSF